jgi:aminopeptidase N
VTDERAFNEQRLYIPSELQKPGCKNTLEVYFESDYVNDCAGVHYFNDKEDNTEYIYTELEPANSHKWFPCFD